MSYNGYLDRFDGWNVWGWAFDSSRPDTSLVIEFHVAHTKIGDVLADQARPDLQQFGNGRHAFCFDVPPTIEQDLSLTARIAGTDFILKGSPRRAQRIGIEFIAGDIVNQCNLRCPFCLVDYANVPRLKIMSRELFDRTLKLLPIIMPGGFWISCLHEPTLHPQLVNFIETVPEVYRDRISFTTNLSRRMDADLLSRLAHSGVHEIRVSLDSLNAEVFSNLRRKAKFDVFMKNLLDLSAALKQGHKRSGLRFITMALKDNSREIPDIVRFGRDLGADAHEVRYMYYEPHLARWGKDHILDLAEWANLEQSLAPLASDTLVFGGPTAERIQQFQEERGLENYAPREAHFGKNELPTTIPDPVRAGALFHHIPLRLHLRWDGLIIAADEPETDFSVDFGLLEQPDAYFNAIRFYAANGHLGGSGL